MAHIQMTGYSWHTGNLTSSTVASALNNTALSAYDLVSIKFLIHPATVINSTSLYYKYTAQVTELTQQHGTDYTSLWTCEK